MQKKLIPLFHYSLNAEGILFLGSAETVGGATDLFVPVNAKHRLYRRTESALRTEPVAFPASFSASPSGGTETRLAPKPPVSIQSLADQLILQSYAPSAVLANETGDILYISGRTGAYLEPAAGKANWNIFAMSREGLRYELADAFQKAIRQKGPVALHGLKVNGREQGVDITVRKLDEPGALQGFVMVVFSDADAPAVVQTARRPSPSHRQGTRQTELEQEVLRVRAGARATHEEMQTFQEELRSANEELQSTNEELQSANEELTTSKEEMQSLNEELQTVSGRRPPPCGAGDGPRTLMPRPHWRTQPTWTRHAFVRDPASSARAVIPVPAKAAASVIIATR